MKGYIYRLKSPSGKLYFGQTVDLKRRKSEYKGLNIKSQVALYNAIKKYGWKNFEFIIGEVIEEENIKGLQQELNNAEIAYIDMFDCTNCGYNISLGGDQGRLGIKNSESTKQKIKESGTEDRRALQSVKWLGSDNPRKDKKFGRSDKAKGINQYNKKGVFIKKGESLMSISEKIIEFSFQNISKVCNEQLKTAYGYIWRFSDETSINNISVTLSRKIRSDKGSCRPDIYIKVSQYSKRGNWLRDFESVTEASSSCSIPTSNISKCCKGTRKSAGGFIWKYLME